MLNKLLKLAMVPALMFAVSACSTTKAEKVAPVPGAADSFKQGEELLKSGKYEKARQSYQNVKESDPDKSYEPLVQVRLGDSYYEEERYAEAEVEYRRFLDMHPHNKAAPYVKYQLGMCSFKQIDLPDRDPSFAVNSIKAFGELLRDYPNNPYEDEAKEKLKLARENVARHEFVVGRYYFNTRSYKAAANRFKSIIDNYPGTKDEPETLYFLADSYIRIGEFGQAENTLAVLYKEHPNNVFTLKAQKKLADRIPVK